MSKPDKRDIKGSLLRFVDGGRAIWLVMAVALVCSLLFCFVVYPRISESEELVLDPDAHSNLAYGILEYHTFSYYPDTEPTVERGPLYPAFMALLLVVSTKLTAHDLYPYCVQVGQCILFVLMCMLVYWMSREYWGRRVAMVTGIICAMHPLTVWYTSRIWVETMSMLLLTALFAGMVFYAKKPGFGRAALVGVILAASALTKGTFTPYIVVVPLLLWCVAGRKARMLSIVTLLVAMALVAPWTYRNWKLTGQFIPVHARMGFNIEIGDELVINWPKSRFSLTDIWLPSVQTFLRVQDEIPDDLPKHERELLLDEKMMKISMERYREDPMFMAKKVLINGIMFWTVGASPQKSMVISVLLLSLATLVIISSILLWRRDQIRSMMGAQIFLMLLYYLMHLPVEAIARYSVVMLPGMIIYGLGPICYALFARGKRSLSSSSGSSD